MKKQWIVGLGVLMGATLAVAQTDLFPELQGQFQAPQPPAAATSSADREAAVNATQNDDAVQFDTGAGNLKLEMQNIHALIPIARNNAFCSADVMVHNETNMPLENLSLIVTYDGYTNNIRFSDVAKKSDQKRLLFMVGKACESIINVPQIDITECRLGKLPVDLCKKRVQFTPPQVVEN